VRQLSCGSLHSSHLCRYDDMQFGYRARQVSECTPSFYLLRLFFSAFNDTYVPQLPTQPIHLGPPHTPSPSPPSQPTSISSWVH
jgi:hypothetical protein